VANNKNLLPTLRFPLPGCINCPLKLAEAI
jgi:hypothetical protein